MNAVGLITEYNPFHNGHLYHLQQSLEKSGTRVSVAVMSGHFLQRGMPALLDKWIRTEMALAAGVDVVLELPIPWACNSAPCFAAGAVASLAACGVESFCFGSEHGELAELQSCATFLTSHAAQIEQGTAQALRSGISYPLARSAAVTDQTGFPDLLATPNNILGISYLQALAQINTPLRPLTIRRIGAGYHDVNVQGEIASATGIRHLYNQGIDVDMYIPAALRPLLQDALLAGKVLDSNYFFRLLAGRLMDEPSALTHIYQVEDGIASRLCQQARHTSSLAELIDAVKVRHLTVSRIQRILTYIFLNLSAVEVEEQLAYGPSYLRILGATAKGEAFLAATRKVRTLPFLSNLSRAPAHLKKYYGGSSLACRRALSLLSLETRATRHYTLLMQRWAGTDRNRDYYESVRRY